MANFNKMILLGNLTKDPELKYTPSSLAVCSFSLAVNNRYSQNGEAKEEVTYIDIVSFGRQAETIKQYLKRGSSVLIEGRLQQNRWETSDGQKRSKHQVVAQSVTFMPAKRDDNSSTEKTSTGVIGNGENDVPF